jgi:hypothetical protein
MYRNRIQYALWAISYGIALTFFGALDFAEAIERMRRRQLQKSLAIFIIL